MIHNDRIRKVIRRIPASYIINQPVDLHPLISDGVDKMVHKCVWNKYIVYPDGRFKMCKICGLILCDEDLDISMSKN